MLDIFLQKAKARNTLSEMELTMATLKASLKILAAASAAHLLLLLGISETSCCW